MGTEYGPVKIEAGPSAPEDAVIEVVVSENGRVIDRLRFDADTLVSHVGDVAAMHRGVMRDASPSRVSSSGWSIRSLGSRSRTTTSIACSATRTSARPNISPAARCSVAIAKATSGSHAVPRTLILSRPRRDAALLHHFCVTRTGSPYLRRNRFGYYITYLSLEPSGSSRPELLATATAACGPALSPVE